MPEPKTSLRPDTLLYIYYIDGIIPAHHPIAAER